jgi:trehalose-6-phosphate synthase
MLSEYGGTANSFSGFQKFNSFDISDFKDVLDRSLSSTPEEKRKMMRQADKACSHSMFKQWTFGYLRHLKHSYDPTRSADFYYLGLSNIDYMVK